MVQAAPVLFDTPATLAKLKGLVREAAEQESRHRGISGGVCRRLSEGSRFRRPAWDAQRGRPRCYRRYFESAITVPGPECAEIGEMARNSSIHLVVGIIERGGATL